VPEQLAHSRIPGRRPEGFHLEICTAASFAKKIRFPLLKSKWSFFYFQDVGCRTRVRRKAGADGVRRLLMSILLIGGFGYEDL
jgi:hypothetical protein